jgi:hypothetical protein
MKAISSTLIGSSLIAGGAMFALTALPAQAASISTSASGTFFGDNYGYNLLIEQDTNDSTIFNLTLTNTSTSSLSGALIDAFAMNINANLGTDFTVGNFDPYDWSFSSAKGGVQFDYVGERDKPVDRITPGSSLTFTFDFADTFNFGSDPFSVWTNTNTSTGAGFGGGGDIGQVAVSFQQLGNRGNDSDLLASNWKKNETPPPHVDVPEPGTTAALGLFALTSLGLLKKRTSVKK